MLDDAINNGVANNETEGFLAPELTKKAKPQSVSVNKNL